MQAQNLGKIANRFDLVPLIPEGDFSVEFIENVFSFDPYSVLKILKEQLQNQTIYEKCEAQHKKRILKELIDEFRHNFRYMKFNHKSYMDLRINETLIFYYSFSILYIARDLKSISGLKFALVALNSLKLIKCENDEEYYLPIENGGKMLELPEFNRDRIVYKKLKDMIESEIIKVADIC